MTKKRTAEDGFGGNAEHRDLVLQFEDHMRAADGLIESLEGEVTELRRDLEEAGAALRVAQEEMAARGRVIENLSEEDRSRAAAEEEVQRLHDELVALRQRNADEQLRLSNEHIASMDALRGELEERRRADVAAAESEGKVAALREEFRKERAALEERHKEEIGELKEAAEQWEERIREGYRELEERHDSEVSEVEERHRVEIEELRAEAEEAVQRYRVEIQELRAEGGETEERHRAEAEALRAQVEGEKVELERALREEFGLGFEEEQRAQRERHAAELHALRSAAAGRELQLQKKLQEAVEAHRTEVQELRIELERSSAEADERRRTEIREIKGLAEGRERELRRAQATRLGEEKEASERRIAALKAQREADVSSLRERHAEELAETRQDLEDRLRAAEERHQAEISTLEERLEEAEARHPEREPTRDHEGNVADEDLGRRLVEGEEERARLEDRIDGLREALEESEAARAGLLEELEASGARDEIDDVGDEAPAARDEGGAAARVVNQDLERRLDEAEAARVRAEERTGDLEARLGEAEEETGRLGRELEEAREVLKQASNPEQRLRSGIALFNASGHTRTVASISKALGLPKVHVNPDGGSNSPIRKPVITFVWTDMAWRRYVSDPAEGVEEPRVYLIGAGDDPSDIHRPDLEPNARMDAQGRLILGIQAW